MKNSNSNITEDDIKRIANVYYNKNVEENQAIAISSEINSLRDSLKSQYNNLLFDTEAFDFGQILDELKKLGHKKTFHIKDLSKLNQILDEFNLDNHMVITMGAGDIWRYNENYNNHLNEKASAR